MDSREIEIELLPWESDPAAFDKLLEFVRAKLEQWLRRYDRSLQDIMSEEELRCEVWRAASRFQEKFVSLPHYVYLRMKVVVAYKARGVGGAGSGTATVSRGGTGGGCH